MLIKLKSFHLEKISDHISALPLLIYYGIFFKYLGGNNLDFNFFIAYMIISIITDLMKKLPYPKFMYQITRRPKEACNCDLLSKGGPIPEGTPGFPSGHMTCITFFAFFIINNYRLSQEQNQLVCLLIPITAWARIYKKCHNLFQVVGGFIFGYLYYLGIKDFNITDYI
jgi:membrane-associated phospholipid phosphatase